MRVRARIALFVGAEPVTSEGDVELKDGADVKKFFAAADQALGFGREKPFKNALKMRPAPSMLLNGDRLDLPGGLKQTLADGDEITVLSPTMGG